jgi:DNA primase
MSVIDEVKQKIDIIDIIGQHVSLTKSGRTFRGLCPFHGEKHPSFYVYPEQQSWHCFGCNTGGDAFSFIMKKQGIDFGEALRELAQKAGVTIPSKREPAAESEEKQKLYQVNQAAALYFQSMLNSPAGEKARKYVEKRGFTAQTIADFQLGYSLNSWESLKKYLTEKGYTEKDMLAAGLIRQSEEGKKSHDWFRDKLMFPIADARGRIIGFGARVLDDSLPKYINSPQTPIFYKGDTLYALNLAKEAIREQGLVVIVEGYMDVITAHQNGFKNVVASMGIAVTEKQVGKLMEISVTEKQVSTLKRITKNITMALDADEAGEEAMLRGVEFENALGAEVKVVTLPKGKDPDDVIKENPDAWPKLLEKALPVVDFTFDMVASSLDLTTAKDKTIARDKLLPMVKEIKDRVRQAHYLQKYARLVNVSDRIAEADLAGIKPRQTKVKAEEPKPKAASPIPSSNIEENCLALLLQHPELKIGEELLPEYFESSPNREIFIARRESGKIEELRDKLDPAVQEQLDALLGKSLSPNKIEQKYVESTLRLQEEFWRSRIRKIAEVLAHEAESGGTVAELSKLMELDMEANNQLGEVFARKKQWRLTKGVR